MFSLKIDPKKILFIKIIICVCCTTALASPSNNTEKALSELSLDAKFRSQSSQTPATIEVRQRDFGDLVPKNVVETRFFLSPYRPRGKGEISGIREYDLSEFGNSLSAGLQIHWQMENNWQLKLSGEASSSSHTIGVSDVVSARSRLFNGLVGVGLSFEQEYEDEAYSTFGLGVHNNTVIVSSESDLCRFSQQSQMGSIDLEYGQKIDFISDFLSLDSTWLFGSYSYRQNLFPSKVAWEVHTFAIGIRQLW